LNWIISTKREKDLKFINEKILRDSLIIEQKVFKREKYG